MKMLIGFLIGLVVGLIVNQTQPGADWVVWVTGYITQPIGNIFLRLLFMLVIPLLFSALAVGIAEMGEIRALKAIGLRTLAYTVIVSSIAVAISLAAVNLLQPGAGVDRADAEQLLAQGGEGAASIVAAAIEAETGVVTELSTSGGTSDARFLKDLCPVIDFGPPNATMHKRDEAVALEDLEALVRIYRRIALAALRT